MPISSDPTTRLHDLFVTLAPNDANGCATTSYALGHLVTATSIERITQMPGTKIEREQLEKLRAMVRSCFDEDGE